MADVKLPNAPSENEISDFLSRVDEIDNVLKGLRSADDDKVTQYMSKADDIIKDTESKKKEIVLNKPDEKDLPKTRTGFSKTSINKDAYKNDPDPGLTGPALPTDGAMDQNSFMAAMEADAMERFERKKVRDKIGNEFKEQGNAEFRQGNFQKALKFYDKAMEQVKDNLSIYTNRAQTRIKLGMFTEALDDCHWGLRLWPTSLKALVHQGHAYLGLKEFDKARDSYQQILTIDIRKEPMVNDYLAAVEREERAQVQEHEATASFEAGKEAALGLVEILNRLNKEGQLSIYYSGGFRAVTHFLKDVEAQTLFRTNGGLALPQTHTALSRCLTTPSMGNLTTADRDLVSAALEMIVAACKDNETSQEHLLSMPGLPCQLTSLLESTYHGQGRILKTRCVSLLHSISCTPAGRACLVAKFDLQRLVSSLFMLMTKASSSYAETAAALLNNLALDKRLKASVRDDIEDKILPAFESLLMSNKTPPSIVALACSTFTNLATDVKIRAKISVRVSFWNAVTSLLTTIQDARLGSSLDSILGLLVNTSTSLTSSEAFQQSDTLPQCLFRVVSLRGEAWLSEGAVTRSLVSLSNVLPHCGQGLSWMADKRRIVALMDTIRDENIANQKAALKCLTTLTQGDEAVRAVVADNKGTSLLLELLKMDQGVANDENNEILLGNATLCLSHLCSRREVCAKLTKTNIIQRLLVLARDGRKPALQANSAILIGKLVKGDTRHLERLRELHGIEILHDCMKHIE